jgi:hypothetical protein
MNELMKIEPLPWLYQYVENHILRHNYDDSHNMRHFLNVVQYVKEIIVNDFIDQTIIEGLSNEESIELLVNAALCHDVIDSKYVISEEEIINLRSLFERYGYKHTAILLYLIDNMSFSKQRKGIEIPSRLRKAMDILGDADKLDAYRPERVIIYQYHKHKNLPVNDENERMAKEKLNKGWIKTILVKRVLEYKDKWLKTNYAKRICGPMHEQVENYVNKHLKDIEMFEY